MLCALSVPGGAASAGEPAAKAAPADRDDPLGPYAETPARPVFWAKRMTGYLTARDGTELYYSVLLPKGKGPFPVVIDYTGYSSSGLGGETYRRKSSMIQDLHEKLIAQGYAVMGLNPRGTGCATGKLDMFGPETGRDGADAVEWAARQPWSTGSIGMASFSYGGMSQIATAEEKPEHLKAIAPGMVYTDYRLDWGTWGGIPAIGPMPGYWEYIKAEWQSIGISAKLNGDEKCAAQAEANIVDAEKPDRKFLSVIQRHPLRDEWTESHSYYDRIGKIDIPVFSVEALQDESMTPRGGYYQEQLPNKDNLWLLQTNGPHAIYESASLQQPLVDYFDRFLKGKKNGFEKRPHVTVWMGTKFTAEQAPGQYLASAPQWQFTKPNFPVEVTPLEFNLGARGSLSADQASAGEPDAYVSSTSGAALDIGMHGYEWAAQPEGWQKGTLTYTTQAFDKPVFAYGSASADLWVSTDMIDTDLQVLLTEVTPDGREIYLQRGFLRVSDRMLDEARSTPVRPILKDTPDAITGMDYGVPVLARVEITKFAHLFKPGSKLRMWVSAPLDSRVSSYSWASNNQIWHDGAHPSKLVLGTIAVPGTEPAGYDPCAGLNMPCRADPLK